jgi:hypothetical protein
MMLADMPSERHICPVTIFLGLAIADGVIPGIKCNDDFTTLISSEWHGWVSLVYRNDISGLAVLRRTGNKSKAISSCPMKVFQLCKMMQAQILRAGHTATNDNLLHDTRTSAQREKRRRSQA